MQNHQNLYKCYLLDSTFTSDTANNELTFGSLYAVSATFKMKMNIRISLVKKLFSVFKGQIYGCAFKGKTKCINQGFYLSCLSDTRVCWELWLWLLSLRVTSICPGAWRRLNGFMSGRANVTLLQTFTTYSIFVLWDLCFVWLWLQIYI